MSIFTCARPPLTSGRGPIVGPFGPSTTTTFSSASASHTATYATYGVTMKQVWVNFASCSEAWRTTLASAWRIVAEGWNSWARDKTDEDFLTEAAYRDLRGNLWQTPLWQIVLHLVNHGTHHRGQAAGFMRSMGHTPPPLDLVAYYRSLS